MTNLVQWVRRLPERQTSPWPGLSLDQALLQFGQFGYMGLGYGPGIIQTMTQRQEQIQPDFMGFIAGAYKSNGPVFACMACRMLLFSEARFQFRRMNNGKPGKLFGTADLQLLETPWPNGTTGDLLAKALMDADLAGNFYCTRVPDPHQRFRIARLRPDWVTIVKGSADEPNLSTWDPTAELLGYIYTPGGPGSGLKPKFYLPEEICHFAPIPDPGATYRGMSWIQPMIQEVLGDKAMTTHKVMFFEGGATPNLVVSMDTGRMDRKTFKEWVQTFEEEHAGPMNAYKTLYLGAGSQAHIVGTNMKDLDYHAVQGQGETRIAAAAGIPAVIVGFSEGLESATYSNYSQARRRFADGTLRPLWRNFCGSIATLINVPGGAELWYDDRDIKFLQDDQADQANVQLTQATAMRLLVDAGYDPDSIVAAIESNDFTLLTHTGLYSVQLRPPGAGPPTSPTDPQAVQPGQTVPAQGNGNGNGKGQGNGNGTPATPPTPQQTKSVIETSPIHGPHSGIITNAEQINVQQLAQALLAKAGK